MFWLAQALALAGCVLSCISYYQKKRVPYLVLQLICAVLYLGEYACLNVLSGVVNNGVWILKFGVFLLLAIKGKTPPTWLTFVFCGLGVGAGLFAIHSPLDWVPIVVSLLITIGVAWGNPFFLRSVVVAGDVGWILYNLNGKAYVAAGYSLVELIATAVSLILLVVAVAKHKQEKTPPGEDTPTHTPS